MTSTSARHGQWSAQDIHKGPIFKMGGKEFCVELGSVPTSSHGRTRPLWRWKCCGLGRDHHDWEDRTPHLPGEYNCAPLQRQGGSVTGKGTTFSCDVSDFCVDQRSRVKGYDDSLRLSFRFLSTAAFLPEWIRSTISTLSVT